MKMDSVLIAKVEVFNYSSSGIIKALKDNFKDVHEFNYQNVMFNEGAEGMRRRLMGMCMMYNPDVCFLHIQTPEPLDIDLIRFLSERCFVILYTFDVRENIDWYKAYAPYVGLILFGDKESIEYYNKLGFKNVDYLQSSADFDLYRPLPEGIKADKEYGEIIFIGNNFDNTMLNFPLAKQRLEMVNFMQETFGERFKVYGMGWPGSRMINPPEEIAAYHSCKVSITHNIFFRSKYTSDRLWRSMGCGAYTLSQYYIGYYHDLPLAASQTWGTLASLKERCEMVLENDEFRRQVAKRQHEYVIKNHNWSVRISKLKQLILNHGYDERMESIARAGADSAERSAM